MPVKTRVKLTADNSSGAKQVLEALIASDKLSRGQRRKAERILRNKRALKRFGEDVEQIIIRDEGEDTPILDKLTAIIDWVIANWDKISKIISFISVLFP